VERAESAAEKAEELVQLARPTLDSEAEKIRFGHTFRRNIPRIHI
jgi:hypothetical protein